MTLGLMLPRTHPKPFDQIGQVMGIEPGAARSYATTAHRALRRALVDGADR